MASKVPDETPRSESEGENRAVRIKRKIARRVSFADTEITSVHFFHRDDDCETPPEPKPSSSDAVPQPDNEVIGFFRDLAGDSDDSGDDEERSISGRKSFLRPLGSPSPGGSSTAGSGTSNDEGYFSGPVSSSFIRPGRLSDSGLSDDIHEETLDTTAFSLHYRSLARSESKEAKTPTAGRLVFEEKTGTKDSNPSGSGSLMAITDPKKSSSPYLVPREKGEDSDDMSIVDENPNRYNYEIFSPTLNALLAESSKDLNVDSSDVFMSFNSPIGSRVQNRDCQVGHSNGRDSVLGFTRENSVPSEVAHNVLSNGLTTGASDCEMQIPNHPISENGRFTEDASLEAVGKTLQFDAVSPHQSPNQQCNHNPVRESSPRTGQCDFVSAPDYGQQPVMITPKSNRGPYLVSPFPKETDFQSDKPTTHIESISRFKTPDRSYAGLSIKLGTDNLTKHFESDKPMKHVESISRFKTPDRSYAGSSIKQGTDKLMKHVENISRFKTPDGGSSIKQGTDKLNSRLSKFSSRNLTFGTTSIQNNNGLRSTYLGTPVTTVNEQLFSADLTNEENRSLVSLDMNQLNQTETPRSTNKLAKAPVSPFGLTSSGLKVRRQSLISENTPKRLIFTSVTDSVFADEQDIDPVSPIESGTSRTLQSPGEKMTLNSQMASPEKDIQPIKATLMLTSDSPQSRESTHSLLSRAETQNSQRETPNQKDAWKDIMDVLPVISPTQQSPNKEPTSRSLKKVLPESSQEKESTQKFSRKELLQSQPAKKLTWSPLGSKTSQSSSVKERTESPSYATLDDDMLSLRSKYESSPRSTAEGNDSDIIDQNGSSESPLITNDVESGRKRGSREVVLEDTNRAHRSPRILKTSQSSSCKERAESPSNATDNDDMLSLRSKYESSPRSNAEGNDRDIVDQNGSSESPLIPKDVESGRKRRRGGVDLEEANRTRKSPRILKSPDTLNIGKKDSGVSSYQVDKFSNGTDRNEADKNEKHWRYILDKFSRDSEQFLSSSIGLLNSRAIDTLEDILNCSLKPRNYEMLGSEVSQKAAENSSRRHKKRIAETSLLLSKIAHEKAKLQLMSAKREKFLKKGYFLKSGLQECQILKSSVQESKIGERGIQIGEYDLQSSSASLDRECWVPSSSADTMKHEIKVLDGEINSLSNTLQSYSKLKGELSYADTLASIQDHLMRRKCCRLIRQDLQLWSVDGFACQNGGYNALLNYQGYLSQRLTLCSGNVPNMISNQLNDTKILKVFPNMGALIPFAFVLNPEFTKRGKDVRCLGQETQATNSLVCNLLDVVEEVQMAQIEISNLVEAKFYSLSGEQLNLRLCFTEFNTGAKVNLTLDVTCLRRGTYPSEILPYEIEVPLVRTQKSESLLDEITRSSWNLEIGFMRIMRICRCVSQLLQASAT